MTDLAQDRRHRTLRIAARWVPTLLLAAATVALYASGLADEISLDSVQANELHLRQEGIRGDDPGHHQAIGVDEHDHRSRGYL